MTGLLTTPRPRDIFPTLDPCPRTATASTPHRRDEQSNADGNLNRLLLPVVLREGWRSHGRWISRTASRLGGGAWDQSPSLKPVSQPHQI